jgi:acetylornithine deacetylase
LRSLWDELDAAIDGEVLVRDLAALVECPSLGGAEDGALHLLYEMAARLGLSTDLRAEDLEALRHEVGYPGEEVDRRSLHTLTITLPGRHPGAPRLVFNGHVDVVPPGTVEWSSPPFTCAVRDGRLYGRGAADMKAGVVAALHALAAVKAVAGRVAGDVVLQAVAGEEDGGIGAFAALRRDAAFAGCVIPEPTAGSLVCATAGALTWRMRITGRAAHASRRQDGVSALDRFLPIHQALNALEERLNADVTHQLMRRLELPYPLSIGRINAGEWASTVPDELVCEGRVGVPVGRTVTWVREELERVVREAADGDGPPPEVTWSGGQFAPAETPTTHPLVDTVQDAIVAVTGRRAPLAGVPYGADMRQYTARGIPTLLYGPGSVDQAHAADEFVPLAEVLRNTRVLARVAARFGGAQWPRAPR